MPAESSTVLPADTKPEVLGPESLSSQEDSVPAVSSRVREQKSLVALWVAAWLEEGYSLSWLASAFFHACIVILLSVFMFAESGDLPIRWLDGAFDQEFSEIVDLQESSLSAEGGEFSLSQHPPTALPQSGSSLIAGVTNPLRPQIPTAIQTPNGSFSPEETLGNLLAAKGGGLDGRGQDNRRRLAMGGGGNAASESAVELGLAWLAAHQWGDGGWRFDLGKCPQCAGECRDSGIIDSTTAPTGLALLCFLGAGYTQHEGPYQDVVANGLYYLSNKMVLTTFGGDLRDNTLLDELGKGIPSFRKSGDMYSHGIATLALCEAYAMTHDKNLAEPAQQAVDFIVHAQHEKGGWRYEPGEPGDTTVSGWQVTALKSALLADLEVPRDVWYRASEFFDSVQELRGATYGYQKPSTKRRSTSVVGLFCRMMLGWPREHPPLLKGMARIAEETPQKNHMYFNYYASQALHHVGGSGWKRWNPRMRDYLVTSQAQSGHERGSWYFDEAYSDRGGRLYTTTLSILTLEVYYRYMPMYQEAFVDEAP